MHIRYNTPQYRKLFNNLVERYTKSDKIEDIEDRVREACDIVFQSDLGVSIWSCEGHDDEPFDRNSGYIMFAARNREAAAILTEVLQITAVHLVNTFSWEVTPEIESNIASREDDQGNEHTYPCIVIRFNGCEDVSLTDRWWIVVTESLRKQLRHRIELQQSLKDINLKSKLIAVLQS